MRYVFLIVLVCAVVAGGVAEAAEYRLLSPLPGGTGSVPVGEEGLINYMAQLFWFLLSAAIILALVMLVIGGVEYVGAAGNTSVIGDAKSRMVNALLGLVLALAAWLILNLINPDLVNLKLSIEKPTLPPVGGRYGAVIGAAPSVPAPSPSRPENPGTPPPSSPAPPPAPPSPPVPPPAPVPGSFTVSGTSPCPGPNPSNHLLWTASPNATAYNVFKCNDSSCARPSIIAATTANSYVDTSITGGTIYKYYIVAKNTSGETESNILTLAATRCSASLP